MHHGLEVDSSDLRSAERLRVLLSLCFILWKDISVVQESSWPTWTEDGAGRDGQTVIN